MHRHGWSIPAVGVLAAVLSLASATSAAALLIDPASGVPAAGGSGAQHSSSVAPTAAAPMPTRVRALLEAQAGAAPFTLASSTWVLVNKAHPLTPARYVPAPLAKTPGGEYELRQDVAKQAAVMFRAASRAGMPMRAVSGYRSYDTQAAYYKHYASVFDRTAADRVSARAGYSEHQTGLALDVGNANRGCELQACFARSALGRWVADNAHRYGFIVRYPQGETPVTGYEYEPWHLRYVGVEVATDMSARQVPTLEQYFGADDAPTY